VYAPNLISRQISSLLPAVHFNSSGGVFRGAAFQRSFADPTQVTAADAV
jgi:hypothetical protein